MLSGVEFEQRFPDGLRRELAHFAFAMEFNFAFRGMDVDVHGGGIDFEKQTADGVASFHQGGVITFEEREIEAAIFNGATVHE